MILPRCQVKLSVSVFHVEQAKKLENFGMITRQCVQLACCLTFGGVLCFIVIIHLYIGVLIFTGINRGDVSELLATADHDCHNYPSQERQFVKHIHQIWNTKEIPEKFQPYVDSCKMFNPGYNHTTWIPSERRAFLKQHYPWFLPTYDGYTQEMMRIDAIRYFLMFRYGGIYLDIDMSCKTSFDDILSSTAPDVGVLLGATEPTGCGTSWLISKPHHPFFNFTRKRLVTENHWYVFPYWTTLISTGPVFLWRSYLNFPCKKQVELIDPFIHNNVYYTHHHLSSWHHWDGPFFIFFDALYKDVIVHFVNYPILVVASVCCGMCFYTAYKKRTKHKKLDKLPNGNV